MAGLRKMPDIGMRGAIDGKGQIKMDITLLIPTFNRPDLLLRELRYYKSVNFRGKIFIGDSSEAAIAEKIKDSMRQFDNSLEIHYYPLPGYDDVKAQRIIADKVTTKYVAYIADDDFLVPSGIEKSIEFLDTHYDYIAAHGIGVGISLHTANIRSVRHVGYYPQPIISEATAAERLTAHLSNYTVSMFSVHRIEAWRAMFKNARDVADRNFMGDLLPSCFSVTLGKIKQLDGLYLIREYHDRRYLLTAWFKWITSEAWYPGYAAFCSHLAESIASQDKITMEEAKPVVEKAFAVYLTRCIQKKPSKWRSFAGQIPGLRAIWNALEPLHNKYCLSNLLRPKSPYYKDFMPVYKIVTQKTG